MYICKECIWEMRVLQIWSTAFQPCLLDALSRAYPVSCFRRY